MTSTPSKASTLRGFSRLAVDATTGVTDLVEAMHRNIAPGAPGPKAKSGRARGIAGFVYRCIRAVTRLVGGGLDIGLAQLRPLLGEGSSSPGHEAVQAALNGLLGDHLVASRNPLAIPMRLKPGRSPGSVPEPTGKLLVLAHGLCMNDLQWNREGHDHGAALARDLAYTPVYLHYNSGLHISINGRELSDQLENLVQQWSLPLEELTILCHSMGGLVTRSAIYYGKAAGHEWPRHLKKVVFLGTPHHGAALERGGNWVDMILPISPYTAPLARLGKIRSAGITDLRHGSLLDEDWEGRDRFERTGDQRRPVPLPADVACYAMAATKGEKIGDGLVHVDSALGHHCDPELDLAIPESRQWIINGIHHFELLSEPEAYEKIKEWLT
jgi:pimeloyl-ACP methyl ester carboxylesterase